MTRHSSRIREVAVEVLSVEPDAVTEEARFKEDLDADSLDLVELVMGLEERFDIAVPEEDLEGVATVGQAVDLVLAKVGRQGMTRRRIIDHRGRPAGRGHRHGREDARPASTSTRSGRRCCAGRVDRGADRAVRPVGARRCGSACEVRDFDPTPYLGPKEARRVDRVTQLGFAAAADALADAGELGADPSRCAVIAGDRHRRARARSRRTGHGLPREGRRPRQPVLRPDDDAERDRRA